VSFWIQFPETDPFKYGLYSYEVLNPEIIVTKSVFISRKFTEDVKIDVSYFYSQNSLTELVKSIGFQVTGIYGSFKKESFIPKSSERLILLARK
jgi:hypothetical protein